ncbi:transcriptional regulator, AraC family [Calothrix sp. PCC 7716]|nr:transcriptional regulator, AraC family [Calothrix sp. PCC 7716]
MIIDFKKHNPSDLLLPRPAILSTYPARWDGFVFEHHCQPAGESDEVSIINGHAVLIFTHINKRVHAERKLDGKLRDDPVQEGDVIIIPQGVGHGVRAYDEAEFFALVMAPTNFESQLIPHFATSDSLLYQIGLAMKTVLENDLTGSRLYAETMVNAVTVHLMQHYATKKPIAHNYKSGLSPSQLKLVIEYINEHLDEDLSLNELSTLTQISPHYFSQLFKQATGVPPHKYVINCRVNRAKELLQKGESISQVAQQVGFANQSHLNLHFVRQFGTTPKQILKNR